MTVVARRREALISRLAKGLTDNRQASGYTRAMTLSIPSVAVVAWPGGTHCQSRWPAGPGALRLAEPERQAQAGWPAGWTFSLLRAHGTQASIAVNLGRHVMATTHTTSLREGHIVVGIEPEMPVSKRSGGLLKWADSEAALRLEWSESLTHCDSASSRGSGATPCDSVRQG